jgi:periplasmic divalent cation tolerance protein
LIQYKGLSGEFPQLTLNICPDSNKVLFSMSYQLVFSTCPDQASAEKLAHQLVTEKLAACVNILPNLTSIYQWQGNIETANEYLLMIKTKVDQYQAIENWIKANHPYELPEIIAVSIEHGLPEYLQWINTCVSIK